MVVAIAFSASSLRADIHTYPVYPSDVIPRDYAYAVRVTQGEKHLPVIVYNRTDKSPAGRTRGGDVNRRFCEFEFDGGEVRVDIRVTEDVKSYSVFPARLALRHAFNEGVISVWVTKPTLFGVRLNDYDKTILSIFAEAPETDVPPKGKPRCLYVDRWLEDGVIQTWDYDEVYIAPGAILNSRVMIRNHNTYVHGRGMVLDPLSDIFRHKSSSCPVQVFNVGENVSGVRVRDIKIVDARSYNFTSWYGVAPRFENVKALSSALCTDGMVMGGKGFSVDGAWLYVGDNALVCGSDGISVKNAVLGTSCAAIFPQGNVVATLEDIDVFRCGEGLLNNYFNGVVPAGKTPQDLGHTTADVTVRRLSGIDCTDLSHFFLGRNMGVKQKRYRFENVVLPTAREAQVILQNDPVQYLVTSNYLFETSGFCIDGEKRPFAANEITGAEFGRFVPVQAEPANPPLPEWPSRVEVNWTCPYKAVRNGRTVRDCRLIARDKGTGRLVARRPPDVKPNCNLVRERWTRQSVWQRYPNWDVDLGATEETASGGRIYRLTSMIWNTGMVATFTDCALGLGAGTYHLAFDFRAKHAATDLKGEIDATIFSDDWSVVRRTPTPTETWSHVELDFDLPIAEADDLVAIRITTPVPLAELELKDISLVFKGQSKKE